MYYLTNGYTCIINQKALQFISRFEFLQIIFIIIKNFLRSKKETKIKPPEYHQKALHVRFERWLNP